MTAIKSLLLHVHDDEGLDARLRLAVTLGRALGAHLACVDVIPVDAYTVAGGMGGAYVNADVLRSLEEKAAELRGRLEKKLAAEDVAWDYREAKGELARRLIRESALADLVITGRGPRRWEFGGPAATLLGDLLHGSRTPLLIAGDAGAPFDPGGVAAIAWNGSHEAAYAVRQAVPLLKMAAEVRVVRCVEQKQSRFPDTMPLEYLSGHGVHAELETVTPRTRRLSAELVEFAASRGAACLVMGGYSHARAGEFLFGGVTRDLLSACPIPLFMAH